MPGHIKKKGWRSMSISPFLYNGISLKAMEYHVRKHIVAFVAL